MATPEAKVAMPPGFSSNRHSMTWPRAPRPRVLKRPYSSRKVRSLARSLACVSGCGTNRLAHTQEEEEPVVEPVAPAPPPPPTLPAYVPVLEVIDNMAMRDLTRQLLRLCEALNGEAPSLFGDEIDPVRRAAHCTTPPSPRPAAVTVPSILGSR